MLFHSAAPRAQSCARAPSSWLDQLAIGASFACLMHCLVLPMLVAASPVAARLLDLPETFHLYAFAVAVPTSAMAMRQGFRGHGTRLPMTLGIVGIALLGAGALSGLSHLFETGLTMCGSILLAMAHVRNWQLRMTVKAT